MLKIDNKFKAFLINGNHFVAVLKHADNVPFVELNGDLGVSFPLPKSDDVDALLPDLKNGDKLYFNDKLEYVGVEGSEAVAEFLKPKPAAEKQTASTVRRNGNTSPTYASKEHNY